MITFMNNSLDFHHKDIVKNALQAGDESLSRVKELSQLKNEKFDSFLK